MLPDIGHNLRPVLNWRRLLLRLFLAAFFEAWTGRSPLEPAS